MQVSVPDLEINGVACADFTNLWVKSFDPGPDMVSTSDIQSDVNDFTYPGVDLFRGPVWEFEVVAEGDTPAATLSVHDRFKAAWRNQGVAKSGGALTELKYALGGRRRVAYGRPRRFASNPSKQCLQGYAIMTAEFELMDPRTYNERWESVSLTINPPLMRGLKEVLKEPLSTRSGSVRQGQIEGVGGTAPTPFLVDITAGVGELRNPWVSVNGVRYQFNVTVPPGGRLRLDTRLGTAIMNGRNVLSTMQGRPRVRDVLLPVGVPVEVSFGGTDSSATATAKYWWRPAHYGV